MQDSSSCEKSQIVQHWSPLPPVKQPIERSCKICRIHKHVPLRQGQLSVTKDREKFKKLKTYFDKGIIMKRNPQSKIINSMIWIQHSRKFEELKSFYCNIEKLKLPYPIDYSTASSAMRENRTDTSFFMNKVGLLKWRKERDIGLRNREKAMIDLKKFFETATIKAPPSNAPTAFSYIFDKSGSSFNKFNEASDKPSIVINDNFFKSLNFRQLKKLTWQLSQIYGENYMLEHNLQINSGSNKPKRFNIRLEKDFCKVSANSNQEPTVVQDESVDINQIRKKALIKQISDVTRRKLHETVSKNYEAIPKYATLKLNEKFKVFPKIQANAKSQSKKEKEINPNIFEDKSKHFQHNTEISPINLNAAVDVRSFPKDFVEAFNCEEYKEKRFKVIYNYKPNNFDEIELRKGEYIIVLERCDDGWCIGISEKTGDFGTFPSNYIKNCVE